MSTKTAEGNVQISSGVVELAITALFIALTYVATAFINIRLPIAANGGLVHLGNVPLFIAAAFFSNKTAALAGGIGMGLFDLLSGWTAWAPFTLVIVAAIGFVFALIINKKPTFVKLVLAVVAACGIKIAGYYLAEVALYGNWAAPVSSIPGNIVQITVAGIIAIPIILGGKQIVGIRQIGEEKHV